MKYCGKCKVKVIGNHDSCPLCQMALMEDTEKEGTDDIFPYIPTIYSKFQTAFKILVFLSVTAIVVSFTINMLTSKHIWWALFVAAGVGCFWAAFYTAYTKRKNIPKNLLYQVVIVSSIVTLWDYMTGWRGWSVDFVIPIMCLANLLVLFILSKIMPGDGEDYMIYMLIGSVFGIAPILFYAFGCLTIVFPSILCVASSIIFLTAVVIFQGTKIWEELKRRFHY